jgi:colicin import membrane protein
MAGSTTASGVKVSKQEAPSASEERLPKWVFVSLLVHGILIVVLLSTSFWPSSKREPPPSYVVDLVGGDRIGGKNLGTKLLPEAKTKALPAEPPAPAKTVPAAALPERIEKKPPKAEKVVKPEKVDKVKAKATEEVALDKQKVKPPKQEERKTEVATQTPSKDAKDDAPSDVDSLEKVRERVMQSAIERARNRAAPAQGSPAATANTKADKGEPLSAGSGEGLGAQSLGKGGVGGEGVLKSVEYIRYVNYMQATLKNNWAWAGPKRSLKALVHFGVKENGEIVGVKIIQSSGDPLYDESVMRAVRKSSPLTAPPENHRKDFADVEYSFQPDQVG